jgi:hypothetical protein
VYALTIWLCYYLRSKGTWIGTDLLTVIS